MLKKKGLLFFGVPILLAAIALSGVSVQLAGPDKASAAHAQNFVQECGDHPLHDWVDNHLVVAADEYCGYEDTTEGGRQDGGRCNDGDDVDKREQEDGINILDLKKDEACRITGTEGDSLGFLVECPGAGEATPYSYATSGRPTGMALKLTLQRLEKGGLTTVSHFHFTSQTGKWAEFDRVDGESFRIDCEAAEEYRISWDQDPNDSNAANLLAFGMDFVADPEPEPEPAEQCQVDILIVEGQAEEYNFVAVYASVPGDIVVSVRFEDREVFQTGRIEIAEAPTLHGDGFRFGDYEFVDYRVRLDPADPDIELCQSLVHTVDTGDEGQENRRAGIRNLENALTTFEQ